MPFAISESVSADMIRELKDLDPEARDNNGVTPLHVAVVKPNSAGLKMMLDVFYSSEQKNTDIDHRNRVGDSILHVCCEEGDVSKVRLLLTSGANLECRGKDGYTILHRLVKVGSTSRLWKIPS
jgi:ankyrin repeat protein